MGIEIRFALQPCLMHVSGVYCSARDAYGMLTREVPRSEGARDACGMLTREVPWSEGASTLRY